MQENIDILRLIRCEQIGPKTFFDLIKIYKNAKTAIEMLPEIAKKIGRLKDIVIPTKQEVEKEIENSSKIGAKIVTYLDKEYPTELLRISDPPPAISIIGDTKILSKTKISIIGSRNCSLNGKNFAYKIANELSKAGFTIVSGLARGIDAAVHYGSLEKGTIAVIAGGIDYIYPPEHKKLYDQIAEKGIIIAESKFGAIPKGQCFPRRNRIIAGLSFATAVIEGAIGSGSLITARMALEYNKELFAMPGFPLDPRSSGTNNLIKNGARILLSANDIIDCFHENNLLQPYKKSSEDAQEKICSNINQEFDRSDVEKLLSSYPVSLEDIVNELKCDISVVLNTILELELAGKIQRHRDNKISLII